MQVAVLSALIPGLAVAVSCQTGGDPIRSPAAPGANDGGAERLQQEKQEQLLGLLLKRGAEQRRALGSSPVYHEFQFHDRFEESGIRFAHQAVDDTGKYYRANHYDHGGAVATADVDGDGLPDLFFTTQLGTNQLWRNLGGGRFENFTDRAGVGLVDAIAVGASFADIDNDGDPDLFVTTVRHGNHLFENQGGGRFQDITRDAGLEYVGHSSGAVFLDFDGDGRVDLFLCNVGVYSSEVPGRGGYYVGLKDAFSGHLYPQRTEYSILYRNVGGRRFEDVSREMNLRDGSWSGDATFADLNGDRFPDLYVANMQGDDHYYENQAGRGFVDKTASYFPKTPWGAMGIRFFDFNQDGRMDLYVTDMHSDMTTIQTKTGKGNLSASFEKRKSEAWCSMEYPESYLQGGANNLFGNAFHLNLGEGRWAEVSDQIGAETLWPWGLSVGDLNADGYEDVFVTAGMGFGFRYGVNSVLLNDQGRKFLDSELVLGIEPRADGRTFKTAFVLDCSGADQDHPFCAGRSGPVEVKEALSSRSSVIVDLDRDGDLDIVTLDMNDRPQVLMSDLSARRPIRYLEIGLTGTRSNRDGLGATVRVHAGGRIFTQYHAGKSGYLGQSSGPLYFGLAEAAKVDRVEVSWPSGSSQSLTGNLPLNGLLTITEPSGP